MAQVKLIDTIKANKLFENVPPDDIKLSINQKDVLNFREGDIIFQTGDQADQLYLLLEGEVKIKYVAPIDGQRIFEKLKGDFFGEREFMEQALRRSSAVANKAVSLYILGRREINELISKHRPILNSIQRLDPTRGDLSDYNTSKEIYSEELSNLLKTSDTLEPFAYTSKKNTQEFNPAKTTKETPQAGPGPESQGGSYPKPLSRTFEDSFNFSDFNTSAHPAEEQQAAEKPPAEAYAEPQSLSWDFTEPEQILSEKPIETQESNSLRFDAPHESSADSFSLNWDTPTFADEPLKEQESLGETVHIHIPEFPTIEDAPVSPGFSSETETALPAPGEQAEESESLSWDFAAPDEDEKTGSGVFNDQQVEPLIPVLESPENKHDNWFGDDLTGEQPIREFEFDEFGNLIASKPEGPIQQEPERSEAEPKHEEMSNFEPAVPKKIPQLAPESIDQDDEFDEDNFIFNEPPAEEAAKFGDNRFKFTASLESKDMQAAQTGNEQKADDLTTEQLQLIIQAAQLTNSNIKLDQVLSSIVQAVSLLTWADRGTLYIVDYPNHEIWSKVIRGDDIEEIRLDLGQGLAGWVAQTGEIINIQDVSKDNRFDPNIDRQTGYKTKSMLCFPIRNKSGIIIAVIQLLNSKRGVFSSLDETFLTALSAHIAISLENAELVEQLLKTDRLTSLGKVAKFLISDIKKPILTIKHLAEHIRKKNLSPDVNQVITMMIEQSNIVVDLVLTTLSFSEGKAVLNKKVIGSHRVLAELLDLLAEYVDYRKTKLFKKLGPDVLLNVDKREMYQAFFQITKNACDAMPQGGELYVTARVSEDDSKLLIAFKDKGVGIPESILEKMFEPFMSHGKPNGVGLGLPITEKIVKEHDGSIHIESELGEGATVIIELPIVKEF